MMSLAEVVHPNNSTLIIIDMQNDYVHRDGATLQYFRAQKDGRQIATANLPSAAESIVPCLVELCEAARAANVPLIWVRTIHDEYTVSPIAVAQGKRFVWADDDWGTAFFDGLCPQVSEAVVTKHRHSAFFGTHLETILGRLDTKTVVLTGVSTPYCVEGTARDAFARDFQVVTVSDATASKVATEHEEALFRLGRVFGLVTDASTLLAVWQEHRS